MEPGWSAPIASNMFMLKAAIARSIGRYRAGVNRMSVACLQPPNHSVAVQRLLIPVSVVRAQKVSSVL